MAGRGMMERRIEALETERDPRRGPMSWIVMEPGETQEVALQRHGPVLPAGAIIWRPVGQPKAGDA